MNAELTVSVTIAKAMDARIDPTVQVHIEEGKSGELLASFEVTAGKWLALTSGSHLTVEGHIGDHLERVGRKMRVRKLDIPRDTAYGRAHGDAAREWAAKQAERDEAVEVRQTNSGWSAIYRSWPTQ